MKNITTHEKIIDNFLEVVAQTVEHERLYDVAVRYKENLGNSLLVDAVTTIAAFKANLTNEDVDSLKITTTWDGSSVPFWNTEIGNALYLKQYMMTEYGNKIEEICNAKIQKDNAFETINGIKAAVACSLDKEIAYTELYNVKLIDDIYERLDEYSDKDDRQVCAVEDFARNNCVVILEAIKSMVDKNELPKFNVKLLAGEFDDPEFYLDELDSMSDEEIDEMRNDMIYDLLTSEKWFDVICVAVGLCYKRAFEVS